MATKFTYCGICLAACGMEVEVESNRIVSLRGDSEHPLSRGFLTPEIPRRPPRRQRTDPRPHNLHPHRNLFDGRHHSLKRPRIPPRIKINNNKPRTPALRLPTPQPSPYALSPRSFRTGHHPIGPQHRHSPVRLENVQL